MTAMSPSSFDTSRPSRARAATPPAGRPDRAVAPAAVRPARPAPRDAPRQPLLASARAVRARAQVVLALRPGQRRDDQPERDRDHGDSDDRELAGTRHGQ